MILLIVTDTFDKYREMEKYILARHNLEFIARDYCTIVHYSQVTQPLLSELKPWAICHSGGTSSDAVDCEEYRRCVTGHPAAQIGFCAGHQVSAAIFGSQVGPMRSLRPGEPDPAPDWFPGEYKERGVLSVNVVSHDPLFEGLGNTIFVWQNHRYHITDLGSDLIPLATSENCPVEAWVHSGKLFYGVQFHPEVYVYEHSDGFKILENFFRLARVHAERAVIVD